MTQLDMPQPSPNSTLGPDLYGDEDKANWPEREIEPYTVALSVSSHLLALAAGGSSNLALLIAMGARSRAGSKLSARGYSQVLTLVGACLVLCLVWSPLEVADLLTFHHTGDHIFSSRVALVLKATLHVFLLTLICAVLVLLAAEAALRLVASGQHGSHTTTSSLATRWCGSGQGNRLWPPVASILAVLVALFLTAAYIATSNESSSSQPPFYVDMNSTPRTFLLALTSLMFCLTLLAGLVLLALLLKESLYWEGGRLHFRRRPSVKLVIPDFLISQSTTTAAENTGGYDPSTATPSPSTPKLLAVVGSETAGDETSPISDLPAAKSLGSRLGVNMAQVLGRRRHTICQIGDSSSGAGGGVNPGGGSGNDPIGKAKQYNYVRKFSVDISALQAQLQNPKIFKDAPFQSDVDLTKKPNGEGGPGKTGKVQPEPLLPLKPLPKRFEGKVGEEGGGALGVGNLTAEKSAQKGTPPPVLKNGPTKTAGSFDASERDIPTSSAVRDMPTVQTPPQPPPPVIMVSADDDESSLQIDGDGQAGENGDQLHAHNVDETTPLNQGENTIFSKDSSTSAPSPQTEDKINVTTSVASPLAKKPTSLAFKGPNQQHLGQRQKDSSCDDEDDSGENHAHGATFDSDLSYASGDGGDGERATAVRMSQLVLLLSATFLLALLPVVVTEFLRERLTARTFVNTRACVLAVWALQTLLYPHLLAWGDRNLHRALRRLKQSFTTALEVRVGAVCCPCCCPEAGESRIRQIEDTSSISQV